MDERPPQDLLPTLKRIAEALERLGPARPPSVGLDSAEAFVWQADRDSLEPVGQVNRVDLVLLRGVARQRETLLENTKRFARGLPANNALLLVASRIADLYQLVGNEAYADAQDPTIAFGTDDGLYGSEATSIHAFQNQTASLIEEELKLLRGRDDSLAPSVTTPPLSTSPNCVPDLSLQAWAYIRAGVRQNNGGSAPQIVLNTFCSQSNTPAVSRSKRA